MSNKSKRILLAIVVIGLGLWLFSKTEMANDLAVEYYDGSAVDTYVRSVPVPTVSWPEAEPAVEGPEVQIESTATEEVGA
jgi:hypothetical protein